MRNQKFVLALFIVIGLSCQRDADLSTSPAFTNPNTPSPPPATTGTGKVTLPTGSNLDVNSFKVLSANNNVAVKNGEYDVQKVTYGYNTQIVVNEKGDLVMMGYNYPGNKKTDINAESTALAMVMTTPAVIFLSPEGKNRMIANVLKDPNFKSLSQTIEASIVANKPLLDTTNSTLLQQFSELFKGASFRLNEVAGVTDPVSIIRVDKTVSFTNDGKAYSSVIGAYKGTQFQAKKVMEGLQFFPTSITEILTSYGGISGNPDTYTYSLKEDGDYTFKVRTGFPRSDEGFLHDEAFYENLGKFSFDVLQAIMPAMPDAACYATIKSNVSNSISTITSLKSNSNLTLGAIFSAVFQVTADNINSLVTCAKAEKNWFAKIAEQIAFVNKAVSIAGSAANATIMGLQWANNRPILDTCFTVKGNKIEPCNATFTDPRDGQIYTIKKIGNKVWMTQNLNYLVFGSYCYSNDPANCGKYGRLYDWSQAKAAVPPGWHLPSDTEWQELVEALGGVDVAGGKMKEAGTENWAAPNTGADNSSGFNALPAGNRNTFGTNFGNIGVRAFWWSSTKSSGTQVWNRTVDNESKTVGRGSANADVGRTHFSVRLVKD